MKKLTLLLSLLILWGCDGDKTFDCTECDSSYQQCNSDETACELKAGKCGTKDDCTDGNKIVCDDATHLCVEATEFSCTTCKEWEQCNTAETACTLLTGRCETSDQCNDNIKTDCETTTHTCVPPLSGTIYPIRKDADQYEGKTVTVTGTITAIDGTQKFYIQEAGSDYRGILIYSETEGSGYKIGDQIEVTGTTMEYNGLSEIKIASFSALKNLGTNTPITTKTAVLPTDLDSNNVEPYEAMLVTLNGMFTVGKTANYMTTIYYNAEQTKYLDVRTYLFTPPFSEGDKLVSITGILSSKNDQFFLLPRDINDFIDYDSVCSDINCNDHEICQVNSENKGVCVCDESDGYFGKANSCVTPCNVDSCGNIAHKLCLASSATEFACECEFGYELGAGGVCDKIPLSAGCLRPIYSDIFTQNITGVALINKLNVITGIGYDGVGYRTAHDTMYDSIDNKNGDVMCVYTGNYHEGASGINCEHSWPQSKGASGDAKSDIHHLYPTENAVNGARGAYPFGTVVSDDPDTYGSGDYISKRGDNVKGATVFEPADQHKGDVARSMFYFAVRYKNPNGFLTSQKQDLLNWHNTDTVSDKEHNRNDAIEKIQNNRNPFVDCPELIDRIDVMHVTFPQK